MGAGKFKYVGRLRAVGSARVNVLSSLLVWGWRRARACIRGCTRRAGPGGGVGMGSGRLLDECGRHKVVEYLPNLGVLLQVVVVLLCDRLL